MKILHYFLGFPPYRSGGLTAFAVNLMQTQAKQGNAVFALWPGTMPLYGNRVSILHKGICDGITSYELISPLPVPLDEGIAQPEYFMKKCDAGIYRMFLENLAPDVIHIHTLMGIHLEFFQVAKELKIRMVFTTHDYFGICPKVTLYKNGACDNDHYCKDCINCNLTALSMNKIKILQSPLYRGLKNTALVKKLRKGHRTAFEDAQENTIPPEEDTAHSTGRMYRQLRSYYISMLQLVDVIHCNSTVARDVYTRFLPEGKCRLLSISNQEINDHRNNPKVTSDKIRLVYLSPAKAFKGYGLIRQVLDEMWNSGLHNFELHIYTSLPNPMPYMKVSPDGYQRSDLPEIFSQADVLLAPSIWYETFGFTVLEALSFGVPVIVSDHVGAKDVIGDGGIIIPANSASALKDAILSLSAERCAEFRKNIQKNVKIKTWLEYVQENQTLYKANENEVLK